MKKQITMKVNGVNRELLVAPNDLLLNILRDQLGLTGAKYGCGIGECGSCTVLIDGEPALSCLTLAIGLDGSEILTVEGIVERDGKLHPLQEAFLENGAVQCGFCTPGMILVGKALLDQDPNPTEKDIRDYIRGNLCRCTGYTQIVKAIQDCAKTAESKEHGAKGNSKR